MTLLPGSGRRTSPRALPSFMSGRRAAHSSELINEVVSHVYVEAQRAVEGWHRRLGGHDGVR